MCSVKSVVLARMAIVALKKRKRVDSLKYIKILSVILLLFLLSISVVNSKPLPPLSIKIQWQIDQNSEQMVLTPDVPIPLVLNIFSQVSVDEMEITLTLPNGVVLLDGQAKEVMSIEGAKPIEKNYVVQISKVAEGYIRAEVKLRGTGHNTYYAAVTLPVVINGNPVVNQKATQRVEKQDYKRTQHNGVWLREYHLP